MDPAIMIFLLSACIKVLLFPAYKSTDFEVHRNWLAITHSLPLSKWYYESTSQWTLDYPPLFAWFEWLMSHFAYLIDPAIVQLSNLEYTSASCVYFQRCSVIFTEIVLCYAVIEFCKYKESSSVERLSLLKTILSFQLLANFGLLIVDHIHFQYNGFLFGVLILSITRILQGRHIEGAMWFAVLLNLKHIFLYIAPAYFIYLLKHYCFNDHSNQSSVTVGPPSLNQFKVKKFTWLGVSVVTIFFASFGPFIINGQLGQVISRLFPFKRGLCHAYWAPNIWAIYNIIDKMSAITASHVGLNVLVSSNTTMTSGLVGEMGHQVLPSISPLMTMILTLLAMCPSLVKLWFKPSVPVDFLKTIVCCGYGSFLFGWHVHEKAVMMITLPMCLLALGDKKFMRIYLLLSFAGHISLFPLLYTSAETLIKITIFIIYSTSSLLLLPLSFKGARRSSSSILSVTGLMSIDILMIIMFLIVPQIYCTTLHGLFGFMLSYPFIPLLITSVSCAIVVLWTWILTLSTL